MCSLAVQLSHGSPLAAVCARGDLDTALPDARGCFDTKVTSYKLALGLQADAITGPTTEVCCGFPHVSGKSCNTHAFSVALFVARFMSFQSSR